MISGRCGLDIEKCGGITQENPSDQAACKGKGAVPGYCLEVAKDDQPRVCDTARLGTVTLSDERCAGPGRLVIHLKFVRRTTPVAGNDNITG